MLKPEIHDPQGEAIAGACHRLGFGQVTGVRQGKRFEVELSGPADEAAAGPDRRAGGRAAGQPGDRGVLGQAGLTCRTRPFARYIRVSPGSVADLPAFAGQLTAENSTVRPEIARVHDYQGPSWETLHNVISMTGLARGAEERMRTRVTGAEEPTVDARFCLVFPREALSVPVMRHVLGDALDQDRRRRRLRRRPPARRDRGLHERAAAQRPRAQVRGRGRDPQEPLHARGRRHRPRVRPGQAGPAPAAGRVASTRSAAAARSGPTAARARGLADARPGWPGSAHRRRARAIGQLPESGRGLAIMRACVDDVTLRSRPGRGTVVSLQKRIELRERRAARPPGRDAGSGTPADAGSLRA